MTKQASPVRTKATKSKSKPLYSQGDWGRELEDVGTSLPPWRTPVARDYARVVHSACFRRLQGKTQVFPGHESDFFRNRLTHSLEVSQIAQAIAEKLNYEHEALKEDPLNPRLCALAGLIHDIGHPPFGHNGERALDLRMLEFGGFEGNAQSLRILARLEKKFQKPASDECDGRVGLNLTWRTLASTLKYDKLIPSHRAAAGYEKVSKGYYKEEEILVGKIKSAVAGGHDIRGRDFKTVECSIMDLADDIAYSTYDLEDSLKVALLTPAGILASDERILNRVAARVSTVLNRKFEEQDVVWTFAEIFSLTGEEASRKEGLFPLIHAYKQSKNIAESSYFRTQLTSQLVNEFVNAIVLKYDDEYPMLSSVELTEPARTKVQVLKTYTYEATIDSSKVKLAEYRGSDVVTSIFDALSGKRGELLMPDDVRELYTLAPSHMKPRVICDFVAGMTDRYALEFYGRLHAESAQSMFKPI